MKNTNFIVNISFGYKKLNVLILMIVHMIFRKIRLWCYINPLYISICEFCSGAVYECIWNCGMANVSIQYIEIKHVPMNIHTYLVCFVWVYLIVCQSHVTYLSIFFMWCHVLAPVSLKLLWEIWIIGSYTKTQDTIPKYRLYALHISVLLYTSIRMNSWYLLMKCVWNWLYFRY